MRSANYSYFCLFRVSGNEKFHFKCYLNMKLGGRKKLGLINSLMGKPNTIEHLGFHISMHDLSRKVNPVVVTLKV